MLLLAECWRQGASGVWAMSMQQLADELASLSEELSAVARDHVSSAASASREKIDGVTKLFGDALHDIEQLVASEEENFESVISSHPLVSVSLAFVTGLAIGLILRRR